MKRSLLALIALSSLATLNVIAPALAHASSVVYELTVTNGLQMPISPAVIYSRIGQAPLAQVSDEASSGLIQLCQSGKVDPRKTEVTNNADSRFVTATTSPILPGETKMIEVEVKNPNQESIHFEAMYGKTKDVCGIGSFNSHSLVALKQHVTTAVRAKDDVILTGAFLDPALPSGMTYLDPSVCAVSVDAISCLRELAVPNPGRHTVRFFAGYLPSLITALETKYGATDVQTLLLPSSGAIQLSLKLKH